MWGSTNTAPQERCCKRVFCNPNLVNPRMIVILEDDYPMAIYHYNNIGSDSNDYNVPLQWDAIGAVDVNLFLIPQKRYASVAMFWSSRREQLFLVGSVLIPPWIQSTQGGPQHEVTKNPIYSRGAPSNEHVVVFFQKLQVAFLWQKLGSWWFLSLINCDISCICLHSDPWLTTVPSPAVSTETAVPKGGTYPHLHHLLLVKREQWIWWYPMDSPKNPRHMGSYTQYVPCHCWLHTIYVFSFNTHWEKLKILSFTSLPRYTGNSLHFVVV